MCPNISPYHAMIRYDEDTDGFEIRALEKLQLNEMNLEFENGW